MSANPNTDVKANRGNLRMMKKLFFITLMMFGFGYALVPIYEKICEVTGVNLLTRKDAEAKEFARNTQVDTTRTLTVDGGRR